MKKEKIMIIGAGLLDVLACPVDKEVFEKTSVSVENIRLSTGGDALNEATVLARLGKSPMLVSVVGKDDAGNAVLSHCRKEGISAEYVCSVEDVETSVNIVMIQPDGSRSFFTNPLSSLRRLSPEHIPERFPEDVGIMCLASIFVSPCLGAEQLEIIFKRAKKQGVIVCADMTKCKNKETVKDICGALSYVDYLFANEEEAALVTGKEDAADMAESFLKCGVRHVIIKLGGRGCYILSKDIREHIPAVPETRCVDTTGAGDSFAGGFLCALSEGKDFRECAVFAGACGSAAVEAVGATAGIVSREQIEERVQFYCGKKDSFVL